MALVTHAKVHSQSWPKHYCLSSVDDFRFDVSTLLQRSTVLNKIASGVTACSKMFYSFIRDYQIHPNSFPGWFLIQFIDPVLTGRKITVLMIRIIIDFFINTRRFVLILICTNFSRF